MNPLRSLAPGIPIHFLLQGLCALILLGMLPCLTWAQSSAKNQASTASNKKPAKVKNVKPKSKKSALLAQPDTLMGPDELAIAERVYKGQLPCELGTTVQLDADISQPGYFYLYGQGFRYRMHPVSTSTGAIRLEDRKAGAVWLQLANKSMLMDQKKGRRLADECAHAEQIAYAADIKSNPPPSLIDTTGMGR